MLSKYQREVSKPLQRLIERRDEYNALSDLEKVERIKFKFNLSHGKGNNSRRNKKKKRR